MKIDGNAVYYLLAREFDDVVAYLPARAPLVDYPLLYDDPEIINGHTVLVPHDMRFDASIQSNGCVFVCTSEEFAQSARDAGLPVIFVGGGVTTQHLYNHMHFDSVNHERLEARLNAYLDTYAGFHSLLDAFAQTMGCSCMLVDGMFKIVTQATADLDGSPSQTQPQFDESDADMLMASRDYIRMRSSKRVFAMPNFDSFLFRNIFAGGTPVGMLIITHDGSTMGARYARFLLGFLAPFIEEMYARLGTFGTVPKETFRIRAMLRQAFGGLPFDAETLDYLLCPDPSNSSGSFAVLRIERAFTFEGAAELDYLTNRIEHAWPRAYCVAKDDELLALVDLNAPEHALKQATRYILPQLVRDMLIKAGISRAFASSAELPAAMLQADVALAQGNVQHPARWVYRFDDYALSWLLAHGRADAPADYVIHPAIKLLRSFDEDHETNLAGTLRTFMACRYNATEAANRLFIARSTLLNRLAKIESLTGVNLDDFEERLYLGMSFALVEHE